ncbi:MAG: polyphosphate kinase 1 [Epulopiscium sp. Nuni2H_MBin003]|nr:MAG: polyphosphate kinase 1 [Epulopiscium sp. Nuni2H_MBin003]
MNKKDYMQNRELSWLNFNDRVLDEAHDSTVPVGDRLRFISIFSNNLDEFLMTRLGNLFDQLIMGDEHLDKKTGMTAQEQIDAVYSKLLVLYEKRHLIYESINHDLAQFGVQHLSIKDLDASEMDYVKGYFKEYIQPILSPSVVSKHFPFPHLYNNRLAIILKLKKDDQTTHGIVSIPASCPKIIFLNKEKTRFILTEYVLLKYANKLFKKFTVFKKSIIRVTRNADVNLDEEINDEDDDYLDHIKGLLKQRGRLAPVRLEHSSKLDASTIKFLKKQLKLPEKYFIKTELPLSFDFVSSLLNAIPADIKEQITYNPIVPQPSPSIDTKEPIIPQIKQKDLLLSYPYESIAPFLTLLKEASLDPKVASIKITIYRMAHKTRIVDYLCRAAENGKDVFVIMELRARFDENNNINWSEKLIDAGCTVVYGLEYFKVHSKVCLISSIEDCGKVSYISQIGTGNYNETTAKVYTDLSLITANTEIGRDIDAFFKNIPTENLNGDYKHIVVSPFAIKDKLNEFIDREILKQENSGNGRIIIKVNSITDSGIIKSLVKASRAGVQIDLIIRGISCLLPELEGYSSNIRITSIIGRFLEHSRIYVFGTGDDMQVYISSADCMPRNLEKRVEVAAPIYDNDLKHRIYDSLQIMLADNVKARFMNCDGEYEKKVGGEPLDAQMYFVEQAYKNASQTSS